MIKMYIKLIPFTATLILSHILTGVAGQAQQYTIMVTAGAFDRLETVVLFTFPDQVEPGIYRMESGSGGSVHLQIDDRRRGRFILKELQAGSSETYSLTVEQVAADPLVTNRSDRNTITITAEGREVISYYHADNDPPEFLDERYRRGGYIHPVKSPEGAVLSAHFNPNHPHHSGIWSAWTNTRFEGRTPDFWNVHSNTGRVDLASLDALWEGPVHAGFRARNHFIDLSAPEPLVALNEEWDVEVYPPAGNGKYLVFDLSITQTVNTDKPLVLPEYRYGGVGFRGHIDWDDPENMAFLTSEGLGRDGHGTRARWCHIGGYSDGKLAGVAILSHPENFRHPQTMRIHPNEPFFNWTPAQLGDMSIEPGSPYVVRYRFVTYDGEPDPPELERLWNDYAYPPGVTVVTQHR